MISWHNESLVMQRLYIYIYLNERHLSYFRIIFYSHNLMAKNGLLLKALN